MPERQVCERLKMRASRQPGVSALLRIFAGTFALLWLVGIAVCGIARVCHCAGHGGICAAHASPVHEHAAVSPHDQGHSLTAEHHHGAEVHQPATASRHDDEEAPKGHCGRRGCEDERCCPTIQALIARMTPIVIAKPVLQPVLDNFRLFHGESFDWRQDFRVSRGHD